MIPLLGLSVRDYISLYADVDVEFNSLSEDHQDLAPEDETHNVSEIHSIVSHAIFSFAALNCLQSGNMDSRVFMEPLNPCLWHSWTPCPWPLYRLSAYNR